jgi:hypothetical protein
MSWFRVDDKSAFHRKVLKAGNEAWGALCRAGAQSSGEGTNGRVTRDSLLAIAPMRVWQRAIIAELLEPIDDSDDFQIHDYLQWNESAEEIEAKAEAKRKKSRDAANARWGARGRIMPADMQSKQAANSNAPSMPMASTEQASTDASGITEAIRVGSPPECPVPNRTSKEEPPVSPPASAECSKHEGRAHKAKPEEPPHPRHREVVDAYFAAFQAARGEKPLFDGKADGAAVKSLLKKCNGNADRAIDIIRQAFRNDPFKARNATIRLIASDPAKYVGGASQQGAYGSGRGSLAVQPTAEEFGEDGGYGKR